MYCAAIRMLCFEISAYFYVLSVASVVGNSLLSRAETVIAHALQTLTNCSLFLPSLHFQVERFRTTTVSVSIIYGNILSKYT